MSPIYYTCKVCNEKLERPKTYPYCKGCSRLHQQNKKEKYIYSICKGCQQPKTPNTSLYCPPCNPYKRKPNPTQDDIKMIGDLVDRITKRNYWFDLHDMNDIITSYYIIAEREFKYDSLPTNLQIVYMWKEIKKYHEKCCIKI